MSHNWYYYDSKQQRKNGYGSSFRQQYCLRVSRVIDLRASPLWLLLFHNLILWRIIKALLALWLARNSYSQSGYSSQALYALWDGEQREPKDCGGQKIETSAAPMRKGGRGTGLLTPLSGRTKSRKISGKATKIQD